MDISLSGKTAVVTGAASGIGRAVVQQFLDSGIHGIVAVDRQPEPQMLNLLQENKERLVYVQGDVSQETTSENFVQTALSRFGRIDLLLNNAAISVVKPIDQHSEEEWDRVMDINVKSVFWSAAKVVPVMKRQGGGLILNTGSISGKIGIPGQGAYAASKGAIHQITRQMAIEYAKDGIRVNAVALGTVDTPMVQSSANQTDDPQKFVQWLSQQHPIGRIATPEEAANFFTFLASDYATFFTGAILSLDGGYTAW